MWEAGVAVHFASAQADSLTREMPNQAWEKCSAFAVLIIEKGRRLADYYVYRCDLYNFKLLHH